MTDTGISQLFGCGKDDVKLFGEASLIAMNQGSDIVAFEYGSEQYLIVANYNAPLELFKKDILGAWQSHQKIPEYSQSIAIDTYVQGDGRFIVLAHQGAGTLTPIHILPFDGLVGSVSIQDIEDFQRRVYKLTAIVDADGTALIATSTIYSAEYQSAAYVHAKKLTDSAFSSLRYFESVSTTISNKLKLHKRNDGSIFVFYSLFEGSGIYDWNGDAIIKVLDAGLIDYSGVQDSAYFESGDKFYLILAYGGNKLFEWDTSSNELVFVQDLSGSKTCQIFMKNNEIYFISDSGSNFVLSKWDYSLKKFGEVREILPTDSSIKNGRARLNQFESGYCLTVPSYQSAITGNSSANGYVFEEM